MTLVGILLATVPLLGGWGSANWAIKWADQVGQKINNPSLKADLGIARSLPSIVGSFLGGLIAVSLGRRTAYFITSLIALGSAQYLFWFLTPDQTAFLVWRAGVFQRCILRMAAPVSSGIVCDAGTVNRCRRLF